MRCISRFPLMDNFLSEGVILFQEINITFSSEKEDVLED